MRERQTKTFADAPVEIIEGDRGKNDPRQDRVQISIPPPPEQRAIAHVLGTLDDKIELNRRMSKTLEAMARALFKSWFIDFDPVRAKATLRNHSPLEGESARQGRSPQARRWGEIQRQYTQQTLQNAQTLRENRTDAEGLLWHYLRDKQLDGGQHAEQQTYDQKRDAFLREQGYTILRFWNHELFEHCFGVLESIYEALVAPLSDHSPLEGESARQGRSPQVRRWGDEKRSQDERRLGRGYPPPPQPSPRGSASATPPQGGSDWTIERARTYLDNMDKERADLFPDRLVDSELGPIPEGWEMGALEDVASLHPESWSPQNAPEAIVYVDLSNTQWGYIEKMAPDPWPTAPSRGRRVLRNGDTIVGTVRPGTGSFSLIRRDGLTGSTGVAVLRPKLWSDRDLVWCIATSQDTIDRLAHLADGGA